jgi:hypothetical protein
MINNDIIIELVKISFIYGMIRDGWKLKMINRNTLQFKKNRIGNENVNLTKLIKNAFRFLFYFFQIHYSY